MVIFVTGVCGQLGHDVVNNAAARGYEVYGSDIQPVYSGVADGSAVTSAPYVQLDITDQSAVTGVIEEIRPDAIIHCAAWTAVDAAEDEENREKVDKINHLGTRYIAEAARSIDCKMLYLSTDYVFDGQGERPWEPDDKCYSPLNIYGQSKLDGEQAVSSTLDKYFIVRIAWVFGVNGKNFIKTMLNLGKTRDSLTVVNDQFGSPTYTYDLAKLLVDMVQTDKYGIYHATNEGICTWYEFACEIFKQAGLNVNVAPVTADQYPAKAKRPSNSRMSKDKLEENGFERLPSWQDALARYLKEIQW